MPSGANSTRVPRTNNACNACRLKKVKCSGQQPCGYCTSRRLDCIFNRPEKRRLISESQIRELEDKVATYEQHGERTPSQRHESQHGERTSSQCHESPQVESQTRPYQDTLVVNRPLTAIAPGNTMSSSDSFSTEVAALGASIGGRGTITTTSTSPFQANLNEHARAPMTWESLQRIQGWPKEEEIDDLIELVVLNVGISQQLFDPRALLDKIDVLHSAVTRLPDLWVAELCLVFAVGRLLQAREDNDGQLPGTALFREAARRTPELTELLGHGVLGIEVKALTALYLQITDRKEDAYLQSSAALRLAIIGGYHRRDSTPGRYGSEKVRRNRLWWSLYMQERYVLHNAELPVDPADQEWSSRLCAAGGYPMSIEDYAISVVAPYNAVGHSAATAIIVNVRTARVAGNIISGIYSDKDQDETLFVSNVQNILRSLYDIEATMPSEYIMGFKQSGLEVSGRSFFEVPAAVARTSASLYASVYTAVIHAVHPILLYMARNARANTSSASIISPPVRRLGEMCVEGASKTLVILQALQDRNVIAKHTFLDLEATFSAAHVFVLVDAIAPGKGLGVEGIKGCKSILRYLADLGNRAAAKRLEELNQICRNLAFPTPPHSDISRTTHAGTTASPARVPLISTLLKPFSFDYGFYDPEPHGPAGSNTSMGDGSSFEIDHGQSQLGIDLGHYEGFSLDAIDPAGAQFDLTNDLYGVYHTDMPLTGVEQTDWEALANGTFGDVDIDI